MASYDVAITIHQSFDAGRFDRSVHPFTGGAGPFDVRITTRYDEKVFMDAVMGTVHEVGHGRCCSPRHRMPFDSRDEDSKCVSMTWRAMFARP